MILGMSLQPFQKWLVDITFEIEINKKNKYFHYNIINYYNCSPFIFIFTLRPKHRRLVAFDIGMSVNYFLNLCRPIDSSSSAAEWRASRTGIWIFTSIAPPPVERPVGFLSPVASPIPTWVLCWFGDVCMFTSIDIATWLGLCRSSAVVMSFSLLLIINFLRLYINTCCIATI